MERKIGVLVLLLLMILNISCYAQEPEQIYEDLEQRLIGDDFFDSLPQNVRKTLTDYSLTPKKSVLSEYLNFEKILSFVTGGFSDALQGTLRDFTVIISITLVFALLSTIRSSIKSEYLSYAFGITAAVAIAVTLFSSIQNGYATAISAISDMTVITKAALPIMATAMASSGTPSSAVTLTSAMLIGLDIISNINTYVLLPMLNIYLGLCIACSVNTNIKISGITKFIKNMMVWGMCLVSTVFTAVLSFQKIITAASDSVATKSAKFAFSSAVPIVGSSLEGALDTVFSCVSMIKNTVGVFAVVAIFITVLPSMLNAGAFMLMLSLSAEISQIAGEDNISELLKNLSSVWSIILAVTVTQVVTIIISLSLILNIAST